MSLLPGLIPPNEGQKKDPATKAEATYPLTTNPFAAAAASTTPFASLFSSNPNQSLFAMDSLLPKKPTQERNQASRDRLQPQFSIPAKATSPPAFDFTKGSVKTTEDSPTKQLAPFSKNYLADASQSSNLFGSSTIRQPQQSLFPTRPAESKQPWINLAPVELKTSTQQREESTYSGASREMQIEGVEEWQSTPAYNPFAVNKEETVAPSKQQKGDFKFKPFAFNQSQPIDWNASEQQSELMVSPPAPIEERKIALPEGEEPNIKRLRMKLEEMGRLPVDQEDRVVQQQNVQLRQLRARLESLRRRQVQLKETKLRLERQLRSGDEFGRFKLASSPQIKLFALAPNPPALSPNPGNLNLAPIQDFNKLLERLNSAMKKRTQLTASVSELSKRTDDGELILEKCSEEEMQSIIKSQNADLNKIRREYQEEREKYEQNIEQQKRNQIKSGLSHSAVSSGVRMEMSRSNINVEPAPVVVKEDNESLFRTMALMMALAAIAGVLFMAFTSK